MAQTLSELLVKLGIDAGGFYRELDKSRRQTNNLKSDLIDLGKKAAAAFAVYKVIDAVRDQVNALDELDEAAQKTGASVEALSRLKYGADLEGVQDFTGAMIKLNRSIVEGQDAASEQGKAFSAIGVSITDASGKLRTTDAVLMDLAESFANIEDSPQKTAVAIALLGKSGAEMIPWLNNGAAGLKRLGDEAERYGLVASGASAAAAAQFNDNLFRMGRIVDGLAQGIGVSLIGQLGELQQKLLDPQMIENAKTLASAIVTAFDAAASAISNTVGAVRWAAETLAAINGGANDLVRIDDRLAEIENRTRSLIDVAAEGASAWDKLKSTIGESRMSASDRVENGMAYTIEHELELLERERVMLEGRKRLLEMPASLPAAPPVATPKPNPISLDGFGDTGIATAAKKAIDDLTKARQMDMRTALEQEEANRSAVAAFITDLQSQEQAAWSTYNAIQAAVLQTTRGGSEERAALLESAEQRLTDRLTEIAVTGIIAVEKAKADAQSAELERRQLMDRDLQSNPLAVLGGISTAEELERMQKPLGAAKQGMLDFAQIANGALSSANAKFGELAANAILFGSDGTEGVKEMGRALVTDVVSGLLQVGTQMLAQHALASLLQAAGVAQTTAANSAILSSAAPAAAAESVATFGAAGAAGIAAMAAAAAAAMGIFASVGGRELGGGVFAGSGYRTNEQDRPEIYRRRSDGSMFLMPGASGGDVLRMQQGGASGVNMGSPIIHNYGAQDGYEASVKWSDGRLQVMFDRAAARGAQMGYQQAVRGAATPGGEFRRALDAGAKGLT